VRSNVLKRLPTQTKLRTCLKGQGRKQYNKHLTLQPQLLELGTLGAKVGLMQI
jgi:hypothetical protein